MAAGDLITSDLEFEFDGVLLGGTSYDFVSVDGLSPTLDTRVSDAARPRDHGLIPGRDFLGKRTVDLAIEAFGTTAADLDAKLSSLSAMRAEGASAVTSLPLVFQLPGQVKRRVNVRCRDVRWTVNLDYALRVARIRMVFETPADPRIYANDATTTNLTLPSVSGGLGWPLGWPLGWGSATGGSQIATNAGTFPTRPVVTFIGPLTSPNIQNLTSGETWACTFDLQSGDQLVVDFDARTVLLNGTASRYSYVTASSVWWELAPGGNELRIAATAGSGSADVVYRSAWI